MKAKTSASGRASAASPKGRRGLLQWAVGGRWIALALLVVGLLAGGWIVLWDYVGGHVLANSQYRLDPHDIEITPPPAWIHSDIKADVIRDAGLDPSLSILEKELTVRIAQAFGLHPWVAKVNRVTKHHPARVEVELTYRQPVVMVEVEEGLWPVDAEGVLLPSKDFSGPEAKGYPRLAGITTSPVGSPGTAWGDGRVTGGAQIAAVLARRWQELKLARIAPSPGRVGVRTAADTIYEIYTQAGTRIIWGHAPAAELQGEMRTASKITELIKRAAQEGALDGGSEEVDLMVGSSAAAAPRPAIKSLPPLDDPPE